VTTQYKSQLAQDQQQIDDQQTVADLYNPVIAALSSAVTSLSDLTVPNSMLGDLHRAIGALTAVAGDLRGDVANWAPGFNLDSPQDQSDVSAMNSAMAILGSDIHSLPNS
jgi:hypothetical protein